MKNGLIVLLMLLYAAPGSRLAAQGTIPADTLALDGFWSVNARLPGELLDSFPGIFPYRTDLPGYWSLFSGNGLAPVHTVVLFDGMRLTDPWTGQSDLNLVPFAALSRITAYRNDNPQGIDAGGGLLACTSQPPYGEKPRTRIFYRSGADKFNELDISFDQQLSSSLSMATGVQLQNNTVSDSLSYLKKQAIRASLFYHPSDALALSYTILQNRTKINLPFSIPLPGDSLYQTLPRRQRIRYDHLLKTRISLPGAALDLFLQHSADEFSFYQRTGGDRRTVPVTSTRITVKQSFTGKLSPLSLGGELACYSAEQLAGGVVKSDNQRLSLQAKLPLGSRFSALTRTALQVSGNGKLYGTAFANLTLQICRGFSAGLYAGSIIQEPTLGQRFGFPVSFLPFDTTGALARLNAFIPNKSLSPERSSSIRLPLAYSDGRLTLNVQPGVTRISHRILAAAYQDTLLMYANGGEDQFMTMSAGMKLGILPGLELTSSLGWNDRNRSRQYAPAVYGRTAVSWRRIHFSGDLNLRLTLALRYSSSWAPYTPLFMEKTSAPDMPGMTTLNATLDAVIIKNARVSIALDNILNSEQALFPQAPLRGRSLRMSLCWTFLD